MVLFMFDRGTLKASQNMALSTAGCQFLVGRILTRATRSFTLGEIYLGMRQTGVHTDPIERSVQFLGREQDVFRIFYRRSPSASEAIKEPPQSDPCVNRTEGDVCQI